MKHVVVALLFCSACATTSAPVSVAQDASAPDASDERDFGIPLAHTDMAHADGGADLASPDLAVNPCDAVHGACSPNATCTSTGATPTCTCNAGYTGDGLACSAPATTQVNEGFDDITNLPGWTMQNSSNPVGSIGWFQGDSTDNFPSYDGASTAYISANFNSVQNQGTISNWLASPPITFGALASVSFYTRKDAPDDYADNLEVRLCTALPCTPPTDGGVGGYTTLLAAVNPNLQLGVYPTSWTQLAYDNSKLPWSGTGRIAIRYYVTNAGLYGTNGDVIGVDRFVASAGSAAYAVRGTVSGLTQAGLVLSLDGVVTLPVASAGAFDFGKHLDPGTHYVVGVATQPTGQTCTVASGSGTIAAADIANVSVACN